MINKLSDGWRTPQWLVNELDYHHDVKLDLCCTTDNIITCAVHRLDDIFNLTELDKHRLNYLNGSYFMNPPYSNPKPFIEKAISLSRLYDKELIMLLKVDTSTKWWGLLWDYENHKPKPGIEIRFLPKRVKFDPPIGWEGKVTTPAFPSCIVIVRPL